MAPSPDVLYGLRVADSVALIAMLLGAPLLKGPAPQPSSDGHSEITSVVHAVKTPRRRLIVSLLSLAALTAFLEALVTVANALFRHVLETKVPSWRGIEFYSVALFVAFGAFVVVGLLKETRGAPIWQSTLLKAFVVTGLLFDLVIVVFIVLAGDWNEEPKPQDPGAHKLGFAPLAHFVLLVLRVLVLLVLFPVLFTSLTSYELVDQNGAAPQTSEASRLIPAGADDAETSAGLGAPKTKYGTFEAAPPVDDAHVPPVDDANAPADNKKRDTGEVPGYSVDTPAGSTREAHTLPIPAVDTPDNLSIVPTEAGAVSLGPGPQIVSGEQLAAAAVQSEHPVPVKPEQQEPSEQPSHVQPDVSFAAVAASAPKAEDAPVLTEEPHSEEPAPIAFPQSEPTPAASPAPLAFPKSDDTPAADSTSPAPQEATSSASTPGITFAPGTDGERLKHAAQRIRKISQGAAAKSQQGLARLARRMSVGPPRASHEGKAEGTPASEDAPKPTEEPKADESAAPVSFPQSEPSPSTSAPLAFPKGEDASSVAGSARPQLREIASTDSATPSVTFAPNTEGGERVKQAAQRIRKISQGAAAKSQQGLARLARRMSVGPSRQSSISSNIASPPGTPGFLSRSASNSVRPSMDDGAEGSGAEDKKKKDKKDKKDKRKSTIAD